MRWVKRAYDVAAPLLRVPKLPSDGQALKYAYITHLAIPSDEPAIMRALLEAVYRDRRAGGFPFLSVCVPEAGPPGPGFFPVLSTNPPSNPFVAAPPGPAGPAPPPAPPP